MKYRKFINLTIVIILAVSANAQVAIGKDNVSGTSTLLDFYDEPDNTRGIILPAVTSVEDVNPVNGTFVFDTLDSKVKMYQNDQWVDLSTEEGSSAQIDINPNIDIGDGTIIGADSSSAEGILILESPDKAMILPKIPSPHLNVKSPYPGMMCFDTATKSLAVFDGSKWYFWK